MWQERRGSHRIRGCDIGQVGGVELPGGEDGEDDQSDQRDGGDDEHHLQRLTDTGQVDTDEKHIGGQIDPPAVGDAEQPERFDIAPMNVAMAAGAIAYSMRMAVPVANPPHGPSARRAKV